ncbi:aminopeptidase P family protein, partial [Odoribacter splanchnicus]|uniref:aminopeptidase P family protein n=1 Tax=Odoribacter splanchnicus TaxID=28118 RepID=UPI00232D62F4
MFETSVYKNRRARLKEKVKSGLVLILGNGEAPANYTDNTYKFRQDSSFLYFFGLNQPGFAGVIDIDSGDEYLFGNDVDMDDIIWMGPQPSVKDMAARVGVSKTAPFARLADCMKTAISQGRRIHFLPPYRFRNMLLLEELLGIRPALVKNYASLELIKAVVDLRSVKEPCEIEEITKACNIGYEMHTAAMRNCKPGVKEQYIAGLIEGIAASYGSMVSFPVILSQNGETLHNHDHSQILQEGRMMLTDAGAEEVSHYCSDFTRTVPVGGKFLTRQKEVYNIVLAANNKAIEIAKPGVTYQYVHLEVCKVLAQGLKDLGLMKGDVNEAVAAGAHALFMPHGLGHMMGLDVHDMEDLGQIYVGYDDETRPIDQFGTSSLRMGRRLQEGFVITDEPGCYFIPALIDQWRAQGMHKEFLNYDKIETFKDFGGIRLEDDILIIPGGSRFLGDKRTPITVEEVEEFISGGPRDVQKTGKPLSTVVYTPKP